MSKSENRRTRRFRPRRPQPPALIPREARLRMLAELSHDVYFSIRFPEGRYEYISPSVEVLFGYTPQDFYADPGTFLRCIAPSWRDQVLAWIADIPLGKVPYEIEFQIVDKTGALRWLRQRQISGPTPDGSAWLFQGVATDITALRAAEQNLRNSEANFRLLIESWPEQVMLSVNLDAGRHEYVSPSMEHVMGYAPQEFYDDPGLGMRMVAPQWQERAWRWIADIRVGVLEPHYEFELVHKNGEHRWVHQVGALRPQAPGQDQVVQFTFRDITERKRAHTALRTSERMSRMLLESMHEGVWAFDRNQNTVFVNERLSAMLGYCAAELMPMQVIDLLSPPQRQLALERLQGFRKGQSGSRDYEILCKDGSTLPVHVSSSPILDEEGGYEGLVCIVVDLSERKHMEEELRKNQARFEALFELSRLTSATETQMARFALHEALRLTGSSAGVLFLVQEDTAELLALAWVGPPGAPQMLHFSTSADTPWARINTTREPLLINDFSMFSHLLPESHLQIERFLGVPALDGQRTAAILGLTGKAGDYTVDDSLHVTLLMDGMWRIVRTRRDEERIRSSLREKEALLREVHHRVKNNLQVVSSILDMAGRRVLSAGARQSLAEVRTKVQAMGLVHAQFHEAGTPGAALGRGINLEGYIQALFRQLREIYSGDMELNLKVALDELALNLDQATPLGLALNEVLANAFKHGRREGQPGRVDIDAWQEPDGRVFIHVCDDGPGLPEDFTPEQAKSLGVKLIVGLVRNQLCGDLFFENRQQGTRVRICFQPILANCHIKHGSAS